MMYKLHYLQGLGRGQESVPSCLVLLACCRVEQHISSVSVTAAVTVVRCCSWPGQRCLERPMQFEFKIQNVPNCTTLCMLMKLAVLLLLRLLLLLYCGGQEQQ